MNVIGLVLVVALVVFAAVRREDPELRMRRKLRRRLRAGLTARPEGRIPWRR